MPKKTENDGRKPIAYRIMDSLQLVRLTQSAARRHFNQYPSLEWLKRDLDPQGRHMIIMSIPHGDGDHLRAVVLVKVKDSMTPAEVLLDMTWESYNKLETFEAVDA